MNAKWFRCAVNCWILTLLAVAPLVASGVDDGSYESNLTDSDKMCLLVDLLERAINNGDIIAARRIAELSGVTADHLSGELESLRTKGLVHLQFKGYVRQRDGGTATIQIANENTLAKPADTVNIQIDFNAKAYPIKDAEADMFPNMTDDGRHLITTAPFRIVDIDATIDGLREIMGATRPESAVTTGAGENPGDTIGLDIADYNSEHLFSTVSIYPSQGVQQFTIAASLSKLSGKKLENPYGILAWVYECPGLDPDDFWYQFLFISDAIRGDVFISEQQHHWLNKYGSLGSGPDNFQNPSDMAWVFWRFLITDVDNHRVKVYKMNTDADSAAPELLYILNGLGAPIDLDAAAFETQDPGWYLPYVAVLDQAVPEVTVYSLTQATGVLSELCSYSLAGMNPTAICWGRNPMTHAPTRELFVLDDQNKQVVRLEFAQNQTLLYDGVSLAGLLPSDGYLTSIDVDNYGYVHIMDKRRWCIYKLPWDLRGLIAKYGSKGSGPKQFTLPNKLCFGRKYVDPYSGDGYYADIGDLITTDHFGTSTGVRRAVAGCDVLAHQLTYVPKVSEQAVDYLRFAWWQTGHARAIVNFRQPNGTALYADTLLVATPGLHRDPGILYFDDNSPDGWYKYTLRLTSIYSGSTDLTITDSLYVERYVVVDPVVVEGVGTFDPTSKLQWDNQFLPCVNASDPNKWWGAYIHAFDALNHDSGLTYGWYDPSYPDPHESPIRLYYDTTDAWNEYDWRFITTKDTMFFRLPWVYGENSNWGGYIFWVYSTTEAYDSTKEWGDYNWMDSVPLYGMLWKDSCFTPCLYGTCQYPGCPYLYVKGIAGWSLVNNILPQSESEPQGDVIDYLRLDGVDCSPQKLNVMISEQESEVTRLDQFELLAFDLPDGQYDDVFYDGQGLVVPVDTIQPVSAVMNGCSDVLGRLLQNDTLIVESDISGYLDLAYRFKDTRSETGSAAASPPRTHMVRGPLDCADKANHKTAPDAAQYEPSGYTVSALDANGVWNLVEKTGGRIVPGRDVLRLSDFVIGDSLVLRIEWSVGVRLNQVPLLMCDSVDCAPTCLHLNEAVHSNLGVVTSNLEQSDDAYVALEPGQEIEFTFSADPVPDGHQRLIIARVEGRYDTPVDNSGGDFTFEQNYPNPFNMSTEFRFSIPAPATVRLEVFNILGQKVATVANAALTAGEHVMTWNGAGYGGYPVASGTYFARLTAGEYQRVRKIVVIK